MTLPTPDVSPALQRGGVQYVITAAASGGRLWRDFFASGLMDPFFVATSYVVINKSRWDKLSADEQAALQKVVDDVSKNYMTKAQEDDDTVAAKEFAEKDKWIDRSGQRHGAGRNHQGDGADLGALGREKGLAAEKLLDRYPQGR